MESNETALTPSHTIALADPIARFEPPNFFSGPLEYLSSQK